MIYFDGAYFKRQSDSACIPKSIGNADYVRALREIKEGTSQLLIPETTKAEAKAAALAAATALGFSLDQLCVIRDLVLLTNGTMAQKLKAAALLQPIVKLAGDAQAITAQIDADLPPDVLTPAIIPTEDPSH